MVCKDERPDKKGPRMKLPHENAADKKIDDSYIFAKSLFDDSKYLGMWGFTNKS